MNDWHVRGSYFEGCNCEAICPCRAVHGQPGGPSTYGECFGALSWNIHDGYADDLSLTLSTPVTPPAQPTPPASTVPGFDHVFVVMMENKDYKDTNDSKDCWVARSCP